MDRRSIDVCLVGQKFMGRTHSNAFLKVGKFFDVPVLPVMHTIAGRNAPELEEFKQRWGAELMPLAYDYYPGVGGLAAKRRDGGILSIATTVWSHLPRPVARMGSALYRYLG